MNQVVAIILFVGYFLLTFASIVVTADRNAVLQPNGEFFPHVRLSKDLLDKKRYDKRVRPTIDYRTPTKVTFSMSLYQILAINEKMQHLELNVWVIQKWTDAFLGWNPQKYGMINSTILPYDKIWLPDTYVYNSVVMNREETERYINVIVTTEHWKKQRGGLIQFMYPAVYRTTCRLNIRYFPYDQQTCILVISSWTSDKGAIDFEPEFDAVNLENFIDNEEWVVVSFKIKRVEQKFVCCPDPWVLLEATLVVRRKPLYYIVNLVIPTSVITLVAVTGFFTPASTSNERREKLSLGIDSLLAHSLLLMMVSEQMPTTSDYVPLFGLFYLSIIVIIFIGTIFTAIILNIHLQKTHNKPIPPLVSYIFFRKIAVWLSIQPSTTLLELWIETGVCTDGYKKPQNTKHLQVMRKRNIDKLEQKLRTQSQNAEENSHYLLASDPLPKLNSMPNNLKLPITVVNDTNGDAHHSTNDLTLRRGSRNSPAASVTARKNWKRLAAHASMSKHQESPDIPYMDSPTPKTAHPPSHPHLPSRPPSRKEPNKANITLPTLSLFGLSSSMTGLSAGGNHASNENALLLAKLRRRNAQEWEFLATVLDRVLLITFSVLVITVTLVMMGIGQAIHFYYALEDRANNITSPSY